MAEYRAQVLPWQAEFLMCQERVAGVIGGLGSGKTAVCSMWLVDRAMKWPMGKHCFAGRDVPQLRRGTIPSILAEFAKRDIRAIHNRSDNTIFIPATGCRLWPLTAENYESFRSLEADTIYADEISDWSTTNEAFVQYLYPRLRPSPEGKMAGYPDLSPQLRFSTNPPQSIAHWLYELLEINKFCKYWQVSVLDNIFLQQQDPEYVPGLLRSMSEEEAHVLVYGQWGYAVKGRVYKAFDRRVQLLQREKLEPYVWTPKTKLLWSLDFNVGYMGSTISQAFPAPFVVDRDKLQYGRVSGATVEEMRKFRTYLDPEVQDVYYNVIGEMVLRDAGAEDVGDEFVRVWGERARLSGGVIIYGDPAGGAKSQQISAQSANRSAWAAIFARLQAAKIPFEPRIRMKSPSVGDRIGAVNAKLKAADGRFGVFINPECTEFIKDLELVQYLPGTNDLDKKTDPERTHISDGFGYMIEVERTIEMRQQINLRKAFA